MNIRSLTVIAYVLTAIQACVEAWIVARHGLTGFITWSCLMCAIINVLFLVMVPMERFEHLMEGWLAFFAERMGNA